MLSQTSSGHGGGDGVCMWEGLLETGSNFGLGGR